VELYLRHGGDWSRVVVLNTLQVGPHNQRRYSKLHRGRTALPFTPLCGTSP
jgi:hypothetical protein